MTTTEFVSRVKVKLNRIDTSSYEDVRPEEVIFFGNNAMKALILNFDLGGYPQLVDTDAVRVYMQDFYQHQAELPLLTNEADIEAHVLKYKDVQVWVRIVDPEDDKTILEEAWVGASRDLDNYKTSDREDNPFKRSYPDSPVYRLIGGKIHFDAQDFTCTKYKYDYLKVPKVIVETDTDLDHPFMDELENKTVSLILENLEARRLQTQPAVSRS
jgi:hypothetical protein